MPYLRNGRGEKRRDVYLLRWGRSEPAVAPDRGGITAFQSSTSHQPPRQVNGVVRWRFGLVTPVASDSCNALALK
jgi:hypothetical protein